VRPLRRFCFARDDVDLCRDLIDLRDARTVRACDVAANDFRGLVFFAPLARNRRPPTFRDLVGDFFTGCPLSAPFETAVARLTVFRTGRPSAAAFPTTAPIIPPMTAPAGPAMLPIAAPLTAPAVCFGIGGTWISSDDGGLFFFSGFGWSGIDRELLNIFVRYKDISAGKVDIALRKLKMPCDTHRRPTRDFESEKHRQLFGANNETLSVAMRISNKDLSLVVATPQSQVSKTSRAI
jgi:hypothetical protein